MKHLSQFALAAVAALALAACGDDAPPQPAESPVTPPEDVPLEPDAGAALGGFNTRATIRDVMNTLIDPHADALWNAVSYVATEEGIEERYPQSDEEWAEVRGHAISMIEGANSLMIPGRRVAPPGSTTEFPDYEYLPEEVQEKLDEDWASWEGFAQGFQQSVLTALEAVESRDVEGLSEAGAGIDAACESCHSQYWYRTL